MTKKAEKKNPALSELRRGAELAFENAEQLFLGAGALLKNNALAHAYFLHQISLEECAKVEILIACAFASLRGAKIDFGEIRKAISDHGRKNRTNAYYLDTSDDEKKAVTSKEASAAFEKVQTEFHSKSNAAKNAALYVNLIEDTFVAPRDAINEAMVAEISSRNEKFLGLMYPAIQTFAKLEKDPKKYQNMFVNLEDRLLAITATQTHSRSDLESLLYEMLDEERAKRS